MSRANPVSRAGLVCRNDFQPGITWGEPARAKTFHAIALAGPAWLTGKAKLNALEQTCLPVNCPFFSLNDKEVHKTAQAGRNELKC